MIRVILFLIVIGALALGVAWLADRPGEVVLTWQGMRIETSLMVLSAAVVAATLVLTIVFSLLRAILRAPTTLSGHLRRRRGARAYNAMSGGLIAVGSGDIAAARKFTAEASRLAPGEPLALLLAAQAAQLAGDREAAERTFQAMAGRPDTKALGLHGLFHEARRRGDHATAHAFAEEAANTVPSLGWAGRAVLEHRGKNGDWAGALALLERNKRTLDKASYQRQRAVLLTARASAIEDSDPDNAKAFALEANKLAPTFVPAAALAARLLAASGQLRKASRILDTAWRANPHPELAQGFMDLRYGDAARDKLERIETLTEKTPGHREAALALARAALDAREFAKARAALAPYLEAPTQRVALLMAEIERSEHNDEGRVREWMVRALHAAPDPAWTADGHVSQHWLPQSPVSGKLDAFEWRVPLAGTLSAPVSAKVIEPESATKAEATGAKAAAVIAAPVEAKPQPPAASPAPLPSAGAAMLPSLRGELPQASFETKAELKSELKSEPKPEPIIPLVHVPDDPGPDAPEEEEIETQIAQAEPGGWRKIFE